MCKLKLFVLLLIVLIVSGCDANYDISINKNLTIDENIEFMESNNIILSMAPSVNAFFDNMVDDAKNAIPTSSDYNIIRNINESNSSVVSNRKAIDFKTFSETSILKDDFFDNLTININDNLVTLFFYASDNQANLFTETATEGAFFDKGTINIKVPYIVSKSNADYIDDVNNEFTWYYDNESFDKNIEITFDKNKVFKVNMLKKFINGYGLLPIIIIGSIIILVIIITSFILIKNRMNNSL